MNAITKRVTVLLLFTGVLLLNACRTKEAPLPDNLAQFESSEQGIAEASTSITIKIQLSRATDRDVPVSISLQPTGVVYGTDYTTSPAAVSNSISLTIPSGNSSASFTLSKTNGVLFDGDEKLLFRIESTGTPVIVGTTKDFTLTFAEIIATASSLVVDGGGANFPNKVFMDLSANKQTSILRTNWDLGLYTHADSFRVILNSSSAMMAKQISKNNLNDVSAADTVGFATEVAFNQLAPSTTALPYIDYPTGDLSRTAIAAVSATATDNKVYIINRGIGVGTPAPSRGWKKIRVVRSASGGYTIQHADINATSFQEIQVAKDNAFFFNYISFENGAIQVEPAKSKWDIAWTYYSNVTNFGAGEVPYLFQDIVIQNRNVQVAKVLSATKSYADFTEADITTQSFSSLQTGIGSDWRSGGGPTSSPSVRTDRYYIVKDGDNNYYKVRFTALTRNGERGYPALEYALLKKGI